MTHFLARAIGGLLCVTLLATGCTKAVEIPRTDIDTPKYREPGSYRIRLKGWEEYLAKRFSVTDSTVVIEELMPSDERFREGRASLPTAIPLESVQSVSHLETNWWLTVSVLVGAGLVTAFFVSLASLDWSD